MITFYFTPLRFSNFTCINLQTQISKNISKPHPWKLEPQLFPKHVGVVEPREQWSFRFWSTFEHPLFDEHTHRHFSPRPPHGRDYVAISFNRYHPLRVLNSAKERASIVCMSDGPKLLGYDGFHFEISTLFEGVESQNVIDAFCICKCKGLVVLTIFFLNNQEFYDFICSDLIQSRWNNQEYFFI